MTDGADADIDTDATLMLLADWLCALTFSGMLVSTNKTIAH